MDGTKHDTDKPRMDLIPPEALAEVAKIFTFGASKYGDHNWRGGIKHSRLYAATQRHLNAHWDGHSYDEESGELHLAHAITNLMMMIAMPKEDDRYIKGE